MAELNPIAWWRRFLDLPNSSPAKTIVVAAAVSLVCAVAVSVTAVSLRPLQQANIDAARMARMQGLLSSLPGLEELVVGAGAESLLAVLVDLDAGTLVEGADAAGFDQQAAATDPATSTALPPEAAIAGFDRRANQAAVFIAIQNGEVALVILPVRGAGYQSTLAGFLALEGDLETIAALSFYEQGDTPGLGARVQDPEWEALWPGTKITDADGNIAVETVKGGATEPWQVDAISGATRTSNGVTNLLRFWLGDYGFGPFLEHLRNSEIDL